MIKGSLKKKLLLLFTGIIVGSITVSITVCLHISTNKLMQDEIAMNAALTSQRFYSIDTEISQLENDIFSSYVSTNLERLLTDRLAQNTSRIQQLKIQDAVNQMAYFQSSIEFLAVQDMNGNLYCAQKNLSQINDQLINKLLSDQESLDSLSGKYKWSIQDGKIIAECLLYQTTLTRPVGYLLVGIDSDYFNRRLHTDQVGYSALSDQEGVVFSASADISIEEWENFIQESIIDTSPETGKWMQGQDEFYYVQSASLAGSNWRLLCALPKSHFTSQMEEVRQSGGIIILISTLISFICIALIADSLSQKVNLLVRRADDIANRNFYNDIHLEAYDELANLSTRLNALGQQMDHLIQQSVKQEKKNGEIEYQCLHLRYQAIQMQLNPHFIYNTLETINSLALLENQIEISQLICRFAQMFRFSVQRNNRDSSLAEEMEYIEKYLSFYQLAYSNRVTYSTELPEKLKNICLPSAILQPLVENALVHGVEQSCQPVEIIVRCTESNHILHAAVIDNGPGISTEQLQKIRQHLANEQWQFPNDSAGNHLSVGLYSIHRLIQLRYGKQYGVIIESQPNIRTIVQINFPIEEKKSKIDQ